MCRGNEKPFEAFGDDDGVGRLHSGLQCSQCPITFKSHSLLRRHLIRAHEEVMLYGCTDCLRMFTSVYELQEHRSTAHINGCGKPVLCPECPKSFSSERSLHQHKRYHRESELIPCPMCDVKFRYPGELRAHLAVHSQARPFQCHLCEKAFKYKRNLQKHFLTHTGLKPHECHLCGCRYAERSSLTKHLRSHSTPGGRPFSCDVCRKRFADHFQLSAHLESHINSSMTAITSNAPLYEQFPPSNSFTNALQEPLQLKLELSEIKKELFVPGDLLKKSFDCTECPETFERRSDWLRHFRIHRGSRPYKCTECWKTFRESSDLRNHLFDHTKELCDSFSNDSNDSCFATSDELEDITDVTSGDSLHLNSTKIVDDISDHISLDLTEPTSDGMDDSMNYCDLTDSLRDDLSDGGFSEWSGALRQLHFRKNSKPHKCPMCRLRFRQVNHLLRHLDTHLPNRPYKCLECNQSFKRSDHLRRHMLTHNAREKPFRCSQCPEQFVSAHYLGRHMRSHAGDKPYSCKYCEYNFRSPSSLERHLRVHNDKTSKRLGTTPNSKTFKCTECLLKFRKKKSLMKHLLEHLGR